MTDFERILEECLRELDRGASSVDQCLARHPEHAAQLRPILLATARLEAGRSVRPSPAFKARARARLTRHIQAHPRKRAPFGFPFMRLATGLAIIVLALLAAGTVYAQSALPGEVFYNWKLASENVWRAISPDPVATDIAIANRRIDEMNAVADDPVRREQALEGYLEVVDRLRSELDAETLEQILPVIGPVEGIEEEIPAPIPTATVTPQPETVETPSLPLPEIVPTETPPIIPTIGLPPLIP